MSSRMYSTVDNLLVVCSRKLSSSSVLTVTSRALNTCSTPESISEGDGFVVEEIAKGIAMSVCSLEFGQGR
jgi:hypothetical protein